MNQAVFDAPQLESDFPTKPFRIQMLPALRTSLRPSF